METTQILHELATAEDIPVEAIRAARENRAALAPAFVRAIEQYVVDPIDPGADRSLFFGFHLLGEWRERSAYRPLAALLRLPSLDIHAVLGDAKTETSHRVMAAVFDGDPAPIYEIIRDPDADDFIRSRMCEALAMVTLRGELPRAQTSAFLRACFDEFAAEDDDLFVWNGWQSAIAMLGLVELVPIVRQAFEREFLYEADFLSFEDFKEDLDRAIAGEASPAGQSTREFELFGDTVEELSSWAAFSGEDDEAADEDGDDAESEWRPHEPVVNPYRDVGRNDPCPCGSGKKFKKCCLGKLEAEERERAAAARFRAEADLDAGFADDDMEDEAREDEVLDDEALEDVLDPSLPAYDAETGPDPQLWLALDEQERIGLVKAYHLRIGDTFERAKVHAIAHVIVENQVAMGDELPVRRKLAALMGEGLDRHDAIHAIGAVLMGHLHDVMKSPVQRSEPDVHDAYFAELERLTAESWRRDFG